MTQHNTIYNNAHASSDSIAAPTHTEQTVAAQPAVAQPAVAVTQPAPTTEQPSVIEFEALGEMLVRTDSVMYREVASDSLATAEAAAIYGTLTESVAPRHYDRSVVNTPLTASFGFQSCVLALLVLYVLMVYRFRSDIIELLTNRKTLVDEIVNPSQGSVYGRFFSTSVSLGLLLGAITVVKGADLAPQVMGAVEAPEWILALAVPSVLVVTMVVAAVQIALLWLIGRAAMCSDVTSTLLRLRKICFSIFTICCTPTVLLYALSEINSSVVLLYVIVAEVVALFLVFLYETFVLFASKKISVLHWILYLCTVELFPVSLIVLTVMREF